MKDKTKVLLMTLLLMSGVSLSSCENTTKPNIKEAESTADVLDVPVDTVAQGDTVVVAKSVQTPKKTYKKAADKVKSKKAQYNDSIQQRRLEMLQKSADYEKTEPLSPEQVDWLQKRYNAQHNDSIQQRKLETLQESLEAEKHERLSPEQADLLQKRYNAQHTK